MSAIPVSGPTSLQAQGRVIHWTRTVSAGLIGLAAIGMIWPALGAGALWIVPVLVLTAGVAGDAIELRDPRWERSLPLLWLVWTPFAFVVAGLPAWTLNPLNFLTTFREMASSLNLGLRDAGAQGDAWMLAGWLSFSGLVWFLAAAQARRSNRASQAVAFLLFAAPFAAPLAFGRTEDAAWQGGAILVAGLLWATRGNLRDGLPALAVVAVAGVAVAAVLAPAERWSGLDRAGGGSAPTKVFSSDQKYGPATRTNGGTMFDIRAERASLWRGEVLEHFDGRVWSASVVPEAPELPQPGARQTTSTVRVEGMLSELAFGPGRIQSAIGTNVMGSALRPGTEVVALSPVPRPKTGTTYTVVSSEVPISPALANIQIPTGKEYRPLTSVFPSEEFPNPAVGSMPEALSGTPYGSVVALAARLSSGASSQLEVVENVQRYLTEGGLYRYSTKVGQPGTFPLVDFLMKTHVGYCQHFAGAAAMLLRMAGVPTRVATGFGTGVPSGTGQWKVRDQDAHAWIEVYFPGQGWVAFDPTPPQSAASVAEGVGQTPASKPKAPDGAKVPVVLVILLLLAAGAVVVVLRRLRRPQRASEALGDVLARVVPAPAGPAMTFAELREDLRQLGPAVTALADEAELQRFGSTPTEPSDHPRRQVWRALLSDVGLLRTLRIIMLGPGRRPIVDVGGPKIPSSGPPPSVAPPGTFSG